MIQKEAFILGASSFCKEAGITGEDRDAFIQLVADGDERTIALVRESMVKCAGKDKKKAGKDKKKTYKDTPAFDFGWSWDPSVGKGPTQLAEEQALTERKAGKGKSKSKKTIEERVGKRQPAETAVEEEQKPELLPAEEATRRVEALVGEGAGALGRSGMAEISELLPRVSPAYQKQLRQRLAGAGAPEMEETYTQGHWTPFFAGEARRGLDVDPYARESKGPRAQTRALTTALQQAGRAGDWDSYKQLLTNLYVGTGGYTPEQAATRAAKDVTDRRVAAAKQPAAPVPAELAATAPAPTAAAVPPAPATPAMGEEERKAALVDAERLLALPPPKDPGNRANMLSRLQKSLTAAAGDRDMLERIATRIAGPKEKGGMNLTTEEMQTYAPLIQQIEADASRYEAWGVLGSIRENRELRTRGIDPSDEEQMKGVVAQAALSEIRPKIRKEIETAQLGWKEPALTAEEKTDVEADERPLWQQRDEAVRGIFESKAPFTAHMRKKDITAEKYIGGRRAATHLTQDRRALSSIQNQMGTNITPKQWATMTDEEVMQRSGGDADAMALWNNARKYGTRLYENSGGTIPDAAGTPVGEEAVSRGVPPEQAAEMVARTPTGLAAERMKPVEEGGVVRTTLGGGMYAPATGGGYMRGAMEGAGMPSMRDIAALRKPPTTPVAPATPAPAEQAVAQEPAAAPMTPPERAVTQAPVDQASLVAGVQRAQTPPGGGIPVFEQPGQSAPEQAVAAAPPPRELPEPGVRAGASPQEQAALGGPQIAAMQPSRRTPGETRLPPSMRTALRGVPGSPYYVQGSPVTTVGRRPVGSATAATTPARLRT